jgi:carbon storage regulator
MLVLSRKLNESIIINDDIRITVVGLRGQHVRLGIEAPDSVAIFREELFRRPGAGEGRYEADAEGLVTAATIIPPTSQR